MEHCWKEERAKKRMDVEGLVTIDLWMNSCAANVSQVALCREYETKTCHVGCMAT